MKGTEEGGGGGGGREEAEDVGFDDETDFTVALDDENVLMVWPSMFMRWMWVDLLATMN